MNKQLLGILLLCSIPMGICAETSVLAFPEAEGFGKYTIGGRGGHVITVNTLDDYATGEEAIEGSLRWALNQYVRTDSVYQTYASKVDGSDSLVKKPITVYEPLTIVFNVSGTIWLKEELRIKRDYLTIAGQSAPGDGICIAGNSVIVNGATGGEMFHWGPRRRDVIIRYLRFRPGPPRDADGNITGSFVTYGLDVENYENVIIDHCTITWANEECLAIYDTKNTTVQWCIVAEGLYSAGHAKGNRSYGGVWGGQFATYHHNLLAHQNSRVARFNGARAHDTIAVIDYRNNVIYNWGSNNSAYGAEVEIRTPETRNELNMVNNYYKQGPATSKGRTVKSSEKAHRIVIIDQDSASWNAGYHSRHYITGNYVTEFPTVSSNNWNYGVQFSKVPYKNDSTLANSLFRAADYSPEVAAIQPALLETAEESYANVLENVGAMRRDWQDARLIDEVRNGTASGSGKYGKEKGIIDTPDTIGGWPELTGEPYTDTDGDGIPDTWETEHGLDPNLASDGAQITESGYSNLEIYLNSLPELLTGIQTPVQTENQCSLRRNGNTLQIVASTPVSNVTLYDMLGRTLHQQTGNGTELSLPLPDRNSLYIVKIMFNDRTSTVRKIF